jgi:arsenite methyltransferase
METTPAAAIQERYGALAKSETSLSCGLAARRCEPSAGDVCVDLGCGRGRDVIELASRVGRDGRVVGVDVTRPMLEAARSAADAARLTNVSFVESHLESLELPDDLADWVVSNCALNHARDKASVWAEICRVLKPGGRFVVSDIYAVDPIAEQYRNDPAAVAECWAGAETKDVSLELIAQAGLEGVRISEESAPYVRGHARLVSFTISGHKPPRPSSSLEGRRTTTPKR